MTIWVRVYCGAYDTEEDQWGCVTLLEEGISEINPRYMPYCPNPACTNGPTEKYPYRIVAEVIS